MAAPTTSVLDTFTRADANTPGGNWAQWNSWSQLGIRSNQLAAVAGDSWGQNYYNTQCGPDDEVYMTLPVLPGTNVMAYVYLGCDVVNNTGYWLGYTPLSGSGKLEIWRWDGGTSFTQLGADMTVTLSAGDKIWLKRESATHTLRAYYKQGANDWVEAGNRIDSTYTAAGYLGVEFDDTTARGDDFGGGTVVSVITGTLSQTLDAATLASAGVTLVSGGFDQALAATTLIGIGALTINGTTGQTLGALTIIANGAVIANSVLDQALADTALSSVGSAPVNGTLDKTLDSAMAISAGVVAISGAVEETLAALSTTASGAIQVSGGLDKTLANVMLVASAVSTPVSTGTLSQVLADGEMSGTGIVRIVGALDRALDAVSIFAGGGITAKGAADLQLATLTLAGIGALPIAGALQYTLADATLIGSILCIQVGYGEPIASIPRQTYNIESRVTIDPSTRATAPIASRASIGSVARKTYVGKAQ